MITRIPGIGFGLAKQKSNKANLGSAGKYLLPCCCICDFILFDMQHDHLLKNLNFGLLSPSPGIWWGGVGWGGGGFRVKYFL